MGKLLYDSIFATPLDPIIPHAADRGTMAGSAQQISHHI